MKHSLFARLQRPLDGRALDIEVEVTGQKVGQHHGGQQVDGVTRLTIYLLGTPIIPFCRLLLGVVFLLYHHTKPAGCRKARVREKIKTNYEDKVCDLPKTGLQVS